MFFSAESQRASEDTLCALRVRDTEIRSNLEEGNNSELSTSSESFFLANEMKVISQTYTQFMHLMLMNIHIPTFQ